MKRASAIIFVRKHKNKYEFLFQHRPAYFSSGGNTLSLVQGGIDYPEASITAAYREACEEASFSKCMTFQEFQKHAIRLSKGIYNVYLLNLSKFDNKCLKKWKPAPYPAFSKEINMTKFKNGHVWISIDMLGRLLKGNTLRGVKIWDKTIHYFTTTNNWNQIKSLL